MTAWLDAAGRFYNPEASVRVVQLTADQCCCVVDNALADPEGVVAWAAGQTFETPAGYPYPGEVSEAPPALTERVADFFTQHVRKRLGARRTLDLTVRLSMVTTVPEQLEPRQWQCHRDRVADDPRQILFAASVLYLFRAPALGGTSFYLPRRPAAETDQMLLDSQTLDAGEFSARHGVRQGYMSGSNAWFERIAQIPAAWNRAIFYDGGLFQSADVDQAGLLSPDPTRGRLTLNSFFTCRRNAA